MWFVMIRVCLSSVFIGAVGLHLTGSRFPNTQSFDVLGQTIRLSGSSDFEDEKGLLKEINDDEHYGLLKIPKATVFSVVDIGANVGVTSLVMAKLFPNATIHAYEPQPNVGARLERNLQVNSLISKQIAIHKFGLGKVSEGIRQTVFRGRGEGATSHCCLPGDICEDDEYCSKEDGSFNASVRDFGNEVQMLGLKSIDVLKIDCEGCEWEIFSSIHEHKLWNRLRFIVGEWHHMSPNCFFENGSWQTLVHGRSCQDVDVWKALEFHYCKGLVRFTGVSEAWWNKIGKERC